MLVLSVCCHILACFTFVTCPPMIMWIIDTGAKVSMIPPTQIAFSLQGVDGSHITTYDVCSLTLNIGLRRTFRWVFVIANVKQAILGADTQQHFGLVVDMWRRTLSDSTTHLRVDPFSILWALSYTAGLF